jgi:tetratricopeptide (TPR) repeat protein
MEEEEAVKRQAAAEAEKLAADFPGVQVVQEQAVNTIFELAFMYEKQGRLRDAVQPFETGLKLFEKLVSIHPKRDDYWKVLLARYWWLADYYTVRLGPEDRNPLRALELVQKGIEKDPKDEMLRQSLGWALCRAGDWKGCIDALSETQFTHAPFLAMAHWKLGAKEKAKACYFNGEKELVDYETRWKPDIYPSPDMMWRVMDEAAAMLGMEPHRRPTTKQNGSEQGSSPIEARGVSGD